MQAQFWILTIPHAHFTPFKPPTVTWIRGQLERGEGGFLHWQLAVRFARPVRLAAVRRIFGEFHAEPTRSAAANEYVWKADTRVEGTCFELGKPAIKRNCPTDWESVWSLAQRGEFGDIPADIRVRCYSQLRRISTDFARPVGVERLVKCYWGSTGTGKSRTAWDEAGLDAYPKDPRTKFWCGYTSQSNVVIDEFRGGIDISHMLRWLDRYPVVVEIKGGATVLAATNIWITSNLHPNDWYPDLDDETKQALLRRLEIVHFDGLH